MNKPIGALGAILIISAIVMSCYNVKIQTRAGFYEITSIDKYGHQLSNRWHEAEYITVYPYTIFGILMLVIGATSLTVATQIKDVNKT